MSHSKSQRPPGLKPAVSREAFRRLQTQRDFQSPKDSTGFEPVVINIHRRVQPTAFEAALRRLIPARIEEMAEYRQSAHVVFDLKHHMIWCTKPARMGHWPLGHLTIFQRFRFAEPAITPDGPARS